jgi:hypothetical protein
MRKNNLIWKSAFAFTTLFYALQPQTSFAAGTITVSNVPKISSATKNTSLGTIFVNIPEGALKTGDQVTFTLPKGFTFNSPFDPVIKTPWNPLTFANGSYLIGGFAQDGFGGTSTSLSNNSVTMKVYQTGTPTDDFKLAIKLGDISVNGVSEGPINISFNAPSTSAFPTTNSTQSSPSPSSSSSSGSTVGTSSTTPVPSTVPTPDPVQVPVQTLQFTLGDTNYILNNTVKAMDALPFVDSTNHLMLPLRFTANALGISDQDIAWNADKQAATLKKGDQVISFTAGQPSYTVNGNTVPMDTSLQIRHNRLIVPVRYLSEALGFDISWKSGTNRVTITFK